MRKHEIKRKIKSDGDITGILKSKFGFVSLIDYFVNRYNHNFEIDYIVGIENGDVIASPLAYQCGFGFIPVRKDLKLNTIQEGDQVVVINDILSTGKNTLDTCKAIEKLGGKIIECSFVVEILKLNGRKKLKGYQVYSMFEV